MRWGIVGCGTIAQQFARDLLKVDGVRLQGVASRSAGKAAAFGEKFGAERSYGTYEELYADPSVDLVYVATPHSEHLRNSSDALRAGKHVLCEKPLVTTPTEARDLIAVHAATDLYLMEAMWTWFLPAVKTALSWVEAGRIGELQHLKADFGYPQRYEPEARMYNPDLAGGALLDMGVYPVALAWLLAKRQPIDIQVVARAAKNGVVDDLSMLLDYGTHVATLGTSFRSKLQNWAYIIGTKGYIAIPDYWRAKEARLFVLDDCVDVFLDDRRSDGFGYEIESVMQDILRGDRESRVCPLSDSLAVQELMMDINLAALSSSSNLVRR